MRRSGRSARRSCVGVLMGAAVVIAAGATPAMAAIHTGGYRIEVAEVALGDNSEGGVTASCDDGWSVLAGGASWSVDGQVYSPAMAKDRWLSASVPVSGGTGWHVAGRNYAAPSHLQAWAYCLPTADLGSVTIRTVEAPAAPRTSATARCPDGQRVVTGGAFWRYPGSPLGTDPTASAGILTDLRSTTDRTGFSARGWRATTFSDATLQVRVVCLPKAMIGPVSLRTATKDVSSNKVFTVSVRCPDGTLAIHGGAAIVRASDGGAHQRGWITSLLPIDAASGFSVLGRTRTATPTRVKVFVWCRPT